MSKLIASAVASLLAAGIFAGDLPVVSTSETKKGVWMEVFANATNLAQRTKSPMIMVWANRGCSYCEELEGQLNGNDFKMWQTQHQDYVYCFVLGSGAGGMDVAPNAGSNAKEFAKTAANTRSSSLSYYPFVCLYWPKADGVVAKAWSRGSASKIMSEAEALFVDYHPRSIRFSCDGSSARDRYEAEPGRAAFVNVKVVQDGGDTSPYVLSYQYPGAQSAESLDISLGGDELERFVQIPVPADSKEGDVISLALKDGEETVATSSITCTSPENGPANPYWFGEKSELEAGDWSMDLDAVTNAVKAGRADYAIVFFTGALWCPHCQGIEDFVFTTDAGRKWAKDNRVVFAVMDNPKRSADANPTKPNGAPPTLLRYEAGSNSYVPNVLCSGTGYLSQKGLVANATTEAVLQRNHTLGYPGGYFCAPEATRTGYPTFILLDNENFQPVARFVRSEEDRSATPGSMKGNYKYYHDLDDHLQRLNDFLKLRDGDGELDSYVSTTPLTYEIGSTKDIEVQLNDRYRAFTLTGLSESGTLTLRATNDRGRQVALDYYVDGDVAASATDELVVKVKKGDLGKRIVVRVNGYPNTAVKLGESSVYDVTLTSSFEPSQIVDSASLPLRFATNVILETLDLEGVTRVTVSKKGALPSGLSIKYDKTTGSIVLTGKPTKAKETTVTYTYTLTYADGRRETSEPVEVSVSTYDPKEVNPYLGAKLSRTVPLVAEGRLVGLLTVSATTSARITAKFTGSEKVSFSGCWEAIDEDGAAVTTLTKKGASLALALDSDGDLTAWLSGVEGSAELSGRSEVLADTASFAGKYSVVLCNESESGVNFGHGSLQLTMTTSSRIKTGTMSYSGVLPDGTTLSGTSQLCADGQLEYDDGTSYACAVLPIYKKTTKTEVAFLLRFRAGGSETYGDESTTLSHVVGSSDRGGCLWNGLALQPFGSWFKGGIALSGWQDVYKHVPTVFDLKLDGVKVATVTASGTKVELTDKPQGSTVSMSYTKSTGKLSGSIRLRLEDGSKLSGTWKGVILPGWHYSCGGCGDDDGVVLPFGMGTFCYTDRSAGKSVKVSLPMTLEIPNGEK